jgi:hypothetical protein
MRHAGEIMTDMRDFTPSNEVRAESAFIDTGANNNEIPVKESYTLDDSGGLGEFHRPVAAEEDSNRGPILGALAVALMLGAAGAVAYSMYAPPAEVVADDSLPRTNAPQTAAVQPLTPPPPATDSAAGESMATAPTDTEMSKPTRAQTAMSPPPAPELATPRATQQRTANAAPARAAAPSASVSSASVTPAPVTAAPSPATVAPPAVTPPQQAASVPEPVSPTPPASAVAGNPPLNEQSAAPAEAAPVTPAPAAAEAAPAAPEAQPAPPAQPLDQSQ